MDTPILHIDMDAFFANVEKRDNPLLKDVPVVVGSHPHKSPRGVVSTCCYIARKFGVRSAMPTTEALRLCPTAVFIEPNSKRYSEVSSEIMKIFLNYTPLVEPISIDEAFLDVGGCEKLFGTPLEIARLIQSEVFNKLGLTCSIGVAPNKFLAKLASDLKKPNGITVINSQDVDKVLDPLPVSKIWGVGIKQQSKLNSLGIKTIADIKKLEILQLESLFGSLGTSLYNLSRGIDERKIETTTEIKSISNETTFSHDISDDNIIKANLIKLADKVSRRLRMKNLVGRTIMLKIRYDDFRTTTSQVTLPEPTSLPSMIISNVWDMYTKREHKNKKVRLIGVGVSKFEDKSINTQLSLFADTDKEQREKRESNLHSSIDKILSKFGDKAIIRGSEKQVNRRDKNGSLV